MSATIIDGKAIAGTVIANIRAQAEALGVPLHLVAVCVGTDAALHSFVKLKQKSAQAAGITFSSYFFDEPNEAEVIKTLDYLAQDETVHGIFVELPLPIGWNRERVLTHIPIAKDVDVISPEGERTFYADTSPILPPAVKALEYVLSECDINLTKTTEATVGQGQLIGRPVAHWLRCQGMQVTSVDVTTPNPEKITAQADLVIAGAGSPDLISRDWIREGAIVIDYGYGRDASGAITGDVDLASVSKKAVLITPVPGGMGPLVIAAVLENLVTLAAK